MVVMVVVVASWRQKYYSEHLLKSLEGPLPADDPELLHYLREQVLEPPSAGPYNPGIDLLKIPVASVAFYNSSVEGLFGGERGGFFVEAGALDGESMSNTLWLEQERGWTGLLVEADRTAFLALRDKRRKAWAANVCLAPTPFPAKAAFRTSSQANSKGLIVDIKHRAMNSLVEFADEKVVSRSWFTMVQCVPLESLLLALGVGRVHLLVLDVEGAERAIMSHLDLGRFDVQVVFLEWKKMEEVEEVKKDMARRGYVLEARRTEDFVFVKKDSQYEGRLRRRRRGMAVYN
ncbi:protein Star-like [Portunus trituberculatus]|uniref:protein Star-like n=1 Tax=Portunus trituberculatus TaxID=210409 RepID=UPI001E1CE6D6|nr:protein Star-like [Portunus trituberculatus]